jgi:hypothetical protein
MHDFQAQSLKYCCEKGQQSQGAGDEYFLLLAAERSVFIHHWMNYSAGIYEIL